MFFSKPSEVEDYCLISVSVPHNYRHVHTIQIKKIFSATNTRDQEGNMKWER